MNSSVTWDSATSVTSSLCLLIRLSSRSKGPSKFSRRTAKLALAAVSSVAPFSRVSSGATARSVMRPSLGGQPLHQHAVVTVGLEVGERHRDGLTDQSSPVDGQALVAPHRESRVLDVEQLVSGHVDRHLLVVTH